MTTEFSSLMTHIFAGVAAVSAGRREYDAALRLPLMNGIRGQEAARTNRFSRALEPAEKRARGEWTQAPHWTLSIGLSAASGVPRRNGKRQAGVLWGTVATTRVHGGMVEGGLRNCRVSNCSQLVFLGEKEGEWWSRQLFGLILARVGVDRGLGEMACSSQPEASTPHQSIRSRVPIYRWNIC